MITSSSKTNLRIDKDVKIGKSVKFHGFVNIYGCDIGDDTRIGCFVEIQKGVKIGSRCKISSHSFICQGVTIDDEVFIGHGVMFCNDLSPKATGSKGEVLKDGDWRCLQTHVGNGASIGSGSTILAGVVIGCKAVVGAGSVVTKNVPPGVTVVGNPACNIEVLKQRTET